VSDLIATVLTEAIEMLDPEGSLKAREVLGRALGSSSRVTRLRAVSMLARFACPQRADWLERACSDGDEAVRQTAIAVAAWVAQAPERPWPDREDTAFDRVPLAPAEVEVACEQPHSLGDGYQYVLEVWRDDGMLVGVYFASTREDDDEHARRMALGQAILASADPRGDAFDPAAAAVFIVDKRRAGMRTRAAGEGEGWQPMPGR